MSEEIKAAENRDGEYRLLQEELNSLQLRLKNYTNIQQKLISANQIIDKQLENYKRLNNYIKTLVEATTIESFKSKIPEAIIDIFNFESSMVVFEDQNHTAVYSEGLNNIPHSSAENIFLAVNEITKKYNNRKPFFIKREELNTQRALDDFDRILVVKCNCIDEMYNFFLVGFVSKKASFNYEAMNSEELLMFDNFSEQMFSILRQNIYKYNLTKEKEKYVSIIDNLNLGLLELDNDDKIKMPNQCFSEIFGYSKEELIGKSAADILFDNYTKKGTKRKNSSFKKNFSDIQEIQIYTPKKQKRDLLVASAPSYDSKGDINGSIGIYLDITKNKELENNLLNSNIELKKINSELDTFVYRVTHDLRTPVLSIIGLIDLIKDDCKKTIAENIVPINLVSESTERLDKTIQEILYYSKNARLSLEIKPIDICETVTNIYNDVRFSTTKLIQFDTNFNTITNIVTDLYRLETILKNIINNAVKYSNPNSDVVSIKFNIEENANKYIITISDNGLGIKEEHVDKIFNMFFRGTSASVGTGLGLFIVKEAVGKLNGNIQVTSKVNVGTTFTIKLPKKYEYEVR
ncbi:PAS domain-containing sensor histidine kinase [Flavobacterium sp.]|uniref:PAS domain-containing sensor histidine kinase n=1 Tax=Flavobacterium sp. TaxID=239 RepID=UPI00248A0FF9|nr:PAS domain-containing sensor histidine kinase [Flavobacterium sp.]MDI1317746.1 PAS domain-containing sensor histidine kinase [Flavobacterium sp.]